MKRYFKSIGYILMASFFAVAFSGCTKQKAAPTDPNATKLIVWSFEDPDIWKSEKKAFENKNKGYTFEYIQQTFDAEYENKVLNSILSGTGPDIWSMPNDWVYRHKGKLAPMPTTLTKNIKMENVFVPAVNQSLIFDDKIYGFSPSAEPLIVYYNEKIFESTLEAYNAANKGEANTDKRKAASSLLSNFPKTWTDFSKVVNLVTQKSGKDITLSAAALGNDKALNSKDILYLLMMQNETEILTNDYKLATFNLPKDTPTNSSDIPGKRALDFYASFSNPNDPNYTWNDSFGDGLEAFANGKVAMIFGYSSLQTQFAQKYPNFKYKKAFVPQLNIEPEKITDYARFNAFGVSKASAKANLAWNTLYSFVMDNSDDYNTAKRVYTSKKASSYDIKLSERESNNPDKLSLATAKSLVKGRYPELFDTIIKNAIFSVNNSLQDSSTALDYASTKATDLLRKETW